MLSAEKLKFLRQFHNLTQQEVADYLNVSRVYITNLENGKAVYTSEQCKKIVNAIYTVAENKKNEAIDKLKETKKVKKEVNKKK